MDPPGPTIRLTILTCGVRTLRTLPPVDFRINCTRLRPPAREHLHSMNGTSAAFRAAFFADPDARDALARHTSALHAELRALKHRRGEGAATLVVYCVMGVHRSVSMAEVLGARARAWRGVGVRVEHLDLERNWERYQRGLGGGV
ncbi:hypothetical protein MMC27_002723 [Xylographa pallens]|nr:hypothetical protein [Xylographa pallens]